MVLVLFQPGSEFDRKMTSLSVTEVAHFDEQEIQEEDIDDDYYAPPDSKRIKIEPGSAAGSSTQGVTLYSITQAISANIGSGWLMQYDAVKAILPIVDAAKQLVAFYEDVIAKASAQLETGAAELKQLAFTLGSVTLVLTGTDVIYWDWIIEFAMSMEDSTNLGNPIQYASTVASTWQQNTIKAEIFLNGVGAA